MPLVLPLDVLPPFRLDLTVWALRRRADNEMDRWDGQSYRRFLILPGGATEVAVTQEGPPEDPRLRLEIPGSSHAVEDQAAAVAAVTRILGLSVDLTPFYRLAAEDERLEPLSARFRGLKPPRFPSVFEALVNAIACQQITLTLGIRVLNRLTQTFGLPAGPDEAAGRAFPRPEDLALVQAGALRALGFSRQKERAATEIAAAAAQGDLSLEQLGSLDDSDAVAKLIALRGVGRWTAEYVLLRGLGRLHVFPGDDVGARGNLQRWLGLEQPLDYEEVARTVEAWRPYAGLVYLHLLLWRLSREGILETGS